jgi:calcium channel MID1
MLGSLMVLYIFSPNPVRRNISIAEFRIVYYGSALASFSCPLAHSIPFCPAVAYAVPIPLPQGSGTSLILDSLSSNITDPLLSSMSNFTQSLLTMACGRDIYSPLQTCADCQYAYRAWLCAVSFPRCSEPPATAAQSPVPPALRAYGANNTTRSLNIGPFGQDFSELLPCIETCQAVTRSCPSLLQWVCPLNAVNANAGYGVGYIDSVDGHQGGGITGAAQDRFGNVWCNLP